MRRPHSGRKAVAGWALAGTAALALNGCATRASAPLAKTHLHCAFATCETDMPSLAQVTAQALGARLESVDVLTAEPQFGGTVMVWRAAVSGKRYVCKEGRDPATGVVHYVTCQPSHDAGPLQAFP